METKSIISLVFLFQLIINVVNLVIAQTPRPTQQYFKCSKGNFKSDALLTERDEGFALLLKQFAHSKPYVGHDTGPATSVWTAGLCPPNIKSESCVECVNNTIPYLKKNCPKNNDGAAWTVLPTVVCMVRYADYRFERQLAQSPVWALFNSPPNQTAADAGELEKGLNILANKLKEPAAGGDHQRKYASGSITYGPGSRSNLYGSMQCTPDLKKDDCLKCLSDAVTEIHKCCSKKRTLTAQTLSVDCYFWYAHANFLPKRLLTVSVTSP